MKLSYYITALCLFSLVIFAGCSSDNNSSNEKPIKLTIRHGEGVGTYIADGDSMSLYIFSQDTAAKSTCYNDCTDHWKPLLKKNRKLEASADINTNMIGLTNRTDGTVQETYNGHPLYYFHNDHQKGDTKGEGVEEFGGTWYLISPDGNRVVK